MMQFFFQSKHTTDIITSVLYVSGKPALVTLDYMIDTSMDKENEDINNLEDTIR